MANSVPRNGFKTHCRKHNANAPEKIHMAVLTRRVSEVDRVADEKLVGRGADQRMLD